MRKVRFAWSQNKGETSVTVVSQIPPPQAEGIDYTELEHFVKPECLFSQCIAGNKGTLLKPS